MGEKHRRKTGTGTILKRTRNGRVQWYAQYDAPRGADGKRRRKTVVGKTHAEAVAKLKTLMGDADAGQVAEPGQLTVAELVERFLAARARTVESTTLATYRHTLSKHVNPRVGGVRLRHLTALHVEDFLKSMDDDFTAEADAARAKGKQAPNRLRVRQGAYDLLSRVLAYGVRLGVLRDNPAARVERPSSPRPSVKALSAEEAQRLLAVARERDAGEWAAIALALCGLRRGEAFGLEWGGVDLERGEVRVRQALKQPAKGKPYLAKPKTNAARRVVPLPSWALAALTAHRAKLGAVPMPGRLVFTSETGSPVHFSNWNRRHWQPLRAAAGLPERATFHGLRHTAATLLLGSGVDVRTTQGIIGHARGSTTLDVYSDFIPGNADRAMGGLDALLTSAERAGGGPDSR